MEMGMLMSEGADCGDKLSGNKNKKRETQHENKTKTKRDLKRMGIEREG
jgi:hypothetical protein